jgi:aminopeptidase
MEASRDRAGLADRLAELAVGFGANVQPGQVVRVAAEVGHEQLVRAVAEAAYRAGARFVDVAYFDPLVQRARIRHAPRETLGHIPAWEVARLRAADASIKLTGSCEPHAFDDLDAARVGRVSLPQLPQWHEVELLINWTVVPAPAPAWADWDEIAFVCRLDEDDPVAAWRERLEELRARAAILDALDLDAVRLHGPGTDLRIGLLGGARWEHAVMVSERGIEHVPNLPTEEVFTVPDPARADGVVRLTRPALVGGRSIDDVTLEFRDGRVVDIEGGPGVEALREFAAGDGADRLGELALVDRRSRVGQLGRTFGVILLDENAASHIALGYGFPETVDGEDRARVNASAFHLDLMVGSEEVAAIGIDADGREHDLDI